MKISITDQSSDNWFVSVSHKNSLMCIDHDYIAVRERKNNAYTKLTKIISTIAVRERKNNAYTKLTKTISTIAVRERKNNAYTKLTKIISTTLCKQ